MQLVDVNNNNEQQKQGYDTYNDYKYWKKKKRQ